MNYNPFGMRSHPGELQHEPRSMSEAISWLEESAAEINAERASRKAIEEDYRRLHEAASEAVDNMLSACESPLLSPGEIRILSGELQAALDSVMDLDAETDGAA